MGIGYVRLQDAILAPVFSFDGRSIRWWDAEFDISHVTLDGSTYPRGDVLFYLRSGTVVALEAGALHGRKLVPLEVPIRASDVEEVIIPEGCRLVAHGVFARNGSGHRDRGGLHSLLGDVPAEQLPAPGPQASDLGLRG